eukprot:2287689-Rhodomonas_salina.1
MLERVLLVLILSSNCPESILKRQFLAFDFGRCVRCCCAMYKRLMWVRAAGHGAVDGGREGGGARGEGGRAGG